MRKTGGICVRRLAFALFVKKIERQQAGVIMAHLGFLVNALRSLNFPVFQHRTLS